MSMTKEMFHDGIIENAMINEAMGDETFVEGLDEFHSELDERIMDYELGILPHEIYKMEW